MSELRRCPCGKVPTKLHVCDNGQGGKWAEISGDCCGEWTTEFRTGYEEIGSVECDNRAIAAWNDLPRNGMIQ